MYSEKLAQLKTTLDQKTMLAVSSANTDAGLRKIIEKYHIHIDVANEVYSVLMLLCYGAINTNEGFTIINNMQAVSVNDFANFIQEVNTQILNPIQNKLKEVVISNENKAQNKYDFNLINPTPEASSNLGNTTTDDDLDDETDETAEEILARIDKEVDAEIDAEIMAEMAEEARQKAEAELKAQQLAKQDTAMSKAQNTATRDQGKMNNVDLDLDAIPKTTANTYIHAQPVSNYGADSEMVIENIGDEVGEPKPSTADFLQAKANGGIISKTETKTYHKDPYHEEI